MKMSKCSWGAVQTGPCLSLRWLMVACLLAGFAGAASAAKTYTDNGDGTLTDATTGLQWMRCSVGQTWNGTTCAGTASKHTWEQANALTGSMSFAGQDDWRLPNVRELTSIVDRSVYGPAIDVAAFPNAPNAAVWSNTPFVVDSGSAWKVEFDTGYTGNSYRIEGYAVRLVRSGKSDGLLDIARPAADYVDHGDGTITHRPTGLMWQRCALGQIWTANSCSGNPSAVPWDTATLLTSNFSGKADWRLPSAQELMSLVDYTKSSPAIHTAVFSAEPNTTLWSDSSYASYPTYKWSVEYSNGYASGGFRGMVNGVRFVRDGPPPVPLSDTDCFLDWAEARLPDLLKPAHPPTQTLGTIQYRAYWATGVYAGIDGATVLVVGPPFGPNVVTVGALSEFLPAARAAFCK